MTKDEIRILLIKVRPIFFRQLGYFTHKRVNSNWYFHSLAFVKDYMSYVFGFNIGFFRENENENGYSKLGMNVLVRTIGTNPDLRMKYLDFFTKNLKDWVIQEPIPYNSERGGGFEFGRYKKIEEFNSEAEMVKFFMDSVFSLNKIYREIYKNPDNIFDDVLRASPPWDLSLLELCEMHVYR